MSMPIKRVEGGPGYEDCLFTADDGVILHQPLNLQIFRKNSVFGRKMNGPPVYPGEKTENAPTWRPRKHNFGDPFSPPPTPRPTHLAPPHLTKPTPTPHHDTANPIINTLQHTTTVWADSDYYNLNLHHTTHNTENIRKRNLD